MKPANILLTQSGVVKVTDFGIARIVGGDITQTGLALGSPSYMSPEQVAGQKVDGRSDIFSLGAALYELLSGEKAFPGETISTIVYRIVHEDPIPLRRLNPAFPTALDVCLKKALPKDPTQRYARAADLARGLRAAAKGEPRPVERPRPPVVTEVARPRPRPPETPESSGWPRWGVVWAAVAGIGLVLAAWLRPINPRHPRPPAPPPPKVMEEPAPEKAAQAEADRLAAEKKQIEEEKARLAQEQAALEAERQRAAEELARQKTAAERKRQEDLASRRPVEEEEMRRQPAWPAAIPRPPDLTIIPPSANLPPEVAAFSGTWEGAWGGILPSRLIVERIDSESAQVVFAWADDPRGRIKANWKRLRARVFPGGRLDFGPQEDFVFEMAQDRRSNTGRKGRGGPITTVTMRKVGP